MRRIFFVLLIGLSVLPFANIAMPGYWSIGTGFDITSPEGEALEHVSMESEEIYVHLYRGFAVVRAVFLMKNGMKGDIKKARIGFPKSGSLRGQIYYHLEMGESENFTVYSNGEQVKGIAEEHFEESSPRMDVWYVWEQDFPAASYTKIELFYVVNTNYASITKGYSNIKGMAFSYILETGASWKGNIGSSIVFIRLCDGITVNDLNSVYDFKAMKVRGPDELLFEYASYEPSIYSNIFINYLKPADGFDFPKILSDTQKYYEKIRSESIGRGDIPEFRYFGNRKLMRRFEKFLERTAS